MKATMTPPETSRRAMKEVEQYEREPPRKRVPKDVSRDGMGYDFESLDPKTAETITIEVKGCGSNEGIPNANIRNFEGPPWKPPWKLIADFLYVVQFRGREAVALRIIPRDEVNSYDHKERRSVAFACPLRTRVKHGDFDAPDFKGSKT
ncbi:MAG: DUF3883 domain-containing protein [Thermoplasmata archaeon]